MNLNNVRKALKLVATAYLTLNNTEDGCSINLSNDNFSIACDSNGDALIGEIGSSGKAICTFTALKGSTKLTATNSTPGTNQFSISISTSEVTGCTAGKKDTDKIYVNTLTTGLSGKIIVNVNIENKTTIKKEITFAKVLNDAIDSVDGKFIFGSTYWTTNQNGTGDAPSTVKVIKSSQAIYGTNILEITNNQWLYSKKNIDIESDKIYRIKFRVRQTMDPTTIANKKIYFGFTPYNSSDTALGTDGAGNTYFITGVTQTVGEWKEYVGYVSTKSRAAITDLKGQVVFPAVKAFPTGSVKFRPMFIVNYSNGNGIAEVDGWILEDATKDFEVTQLQHKATKIESDINGINLSVSKLQTVTDMSVSPMKLAAKVNYSSFTTEDEGEFYLHGLNENRQPADIDGVCYWNNKEVTLPKVMFNPNGGVPHHKVIYIVFDIATKKWWSVWKEDNNGTISWKKKFSNQATENTLLDVTWNETNDIVVGYYIVKKTDPKNSEAPILLTQLFNGALNYKQAINMSLSSSVTQIELLEDEMELKVQKNNVIASINLYTQTNDDGTTSGVRIKGDKIDLQGQVTFSSLADSDVSGSIKNIFSQVDNKTVINGGMIQTNTIKGNDLNLKGNLTVSKTVNNKVINTFAVKDNGDIEIDGILKSSNFSENQNTGYKIDTDGTAIFNQAQIKGDVILARAGMTNFGGPIGNPNLAINSYERKVTTWRNIVNDTSGYQNVYLPKDAAVGDKICVAYTVIYSDIVKTQDTARIYIQGSGNVTQWNNGAWNGGTQFTSDPRFQWGVGKSGEFRIEYSFTLSTEMLTNQYWSVGLRADYIESGTLYIKEFKAEKGDSHTPWCPYETEQDNHVRIWAGSEYDKRDSAPFRVYQNGDIFATNGTFSGRVLGHIDSGNIHINDGEFVINSTLNYIDNNNLITECALNSLTKDANPNPYIMFSANKNFINTDLVFGTTDNPRIKYFNANNKLDINVNTNINTGTTALIAQNGTEWNNGIKFSSRLAGNNGSVIFNFRADANKSEYLNTLYITADGGKGTSFGDICMRRSNWDDDFDLRVRGNIQIKNKITSDQNSIELRSYANGWGFYVI